MFVVTSRLGFLSDASGRGCGCGWRCVQVHRAAHRKRTWTVFVAPLSKQQTQAYVEEFAASMAQFGAALAASPDVAGLASSPLMLFMVLTILPSKAEGALLFPKLRLVEVYAFFRVWLRRDLQRGNYADLKLSDNEWTRRWRPRRSSIWTFVGGWRSRCSSAA